MKKKIAILGSTGSIGKTLLKIINNDKKNFEIVLLTADKNYKELFNQAKKFKVKNLIINNKKSFEFLEKEIKNSKINLYNNFNYLDKILNIKCDYIMSAITGINGLIPTIKSIKFTKSIAIANKEAIICGWNLIQKELKKNKTNFIPVDSEHFTIWYGIKNNQDEIENIFLTASGGPFLSLPIRKFKNISVKEALKHPNWKMGKKISIDSSTMMNKVFETIEAKNIFSLNYKNISIVTHPKSYIHSIIKFKNGLIKIIAHDTNMKIPIFNSIYKSKDKMKINSNKINFDILNKPQFNKVNVKRFPLIKILNRLPNKTSLFETILVSANDELVNLFLLKKIKFSEISKKLINFINKAEFKKYKSIIPKKAEEIMFLNKYVRSKINSKSI